MLRIDSFGDGYVQDGVPSANCRALPSRKRTGRFVGANNCTGGGGGRAVDAEHINHSTHHRLQSFGIDTLVSVVFCCLAQHAARGVIGFRDVRAPQWHCVL